MQIGKKNMQITILAVGSRGDVQPYVALGLGLQAAGHKVQLATYRLFEEFVTSRGLDFAPIGSNPQEYINALSRNVDYWRIFRSNLERLMADCWNCCQETEAIVYSQVALPGYHIAEKLRVPCVAAYTNPLTRTAAFPHPFYTLPFNLGGTYNWLTYVLHEQVRWQSMRKTINQWRQQTLNLPPVGFSGLYHRQQKQQIPILHCLSPSVIPRPHDWPDRAHITGYWFLERSTDWQPPADLVDFLKSGWPPVYIGFGSMGEHNPEAMTEMTDLVLRALAETGQRGILLTNHSISNADLPDNVFKIASQPHDWLFPQMAAIVHHGGAGTTAAALRAGVPSVIIPFGIDQPFWGKRVADLGVGPKPILRKHLTAERLAATIRTVTSDKAMSDRARTLGEKIRTEDGVARAVEIFHRYLPCR